MEQVLKSQYSNLLWKKVCEKMDAFASDNFNEETKQNYQLPLTGFDVNITGPLYRYFYKEVTGKDEEPISDVNEIMRKNSFDRQLQSPFKGSMNTSTLDMYAKFVGFNSFEEFAQKNPIVIKSPEQAKTKNIIYFAFGSFFLVICFLAYFLLKSNRDVEKRILPFDEEKHVYEFLEAAIGAEFNTYKKCPSIDTSLVAKYYDKKCDDYWASIFRVLTIHHEKKLSITNLGNKSFFKIIDKNIVAVNKDTLIVKTKESWELLWFKPETMQYDSSRIRKSTFYNTYKIQRKANEFKVICVKMDSLNRLYDWTKYVK